MSKKIQITIGADGRLSAETIGMKGNECTQYLAILEELLEAEILDSDYTADFFETFSVADSIINRQHSEVKNYE